MQAATGEPQCAYQSTSNYSSGVTTPTRNRRDSYASTTSNITCTSYAHSNTATNAFNCYTNVPNDYKENKAYELRKKSNLMNKIIVKTQAQDPIYTRAHPVCAELTAEQQLFSPPASLPAYEHNSAARKRLFAKKNERTPITSAGGVVSAFDANLSLGSNGSNASSTGQSSSRSNADHQMIPKLG